MAIAELVAKLEMYSAVKLARPSTTSSVFPWIMFPKKIGIVPFASRDSVKE